MDISNTSTGNAEMDIGKTNKENSKLTYRKKFSWLNVRKEGSSTSKEVQLSEEGETELCGTRC